ncbi:hypothetical protein [Deinococcus aquatilis]|uniref:hypothetical protein n=1 Tax=Deinococcus aquatilis TaxID=519440 RepID=UPI00035CB001|nr:hypothetical protein [Deinococcus aquatilis]
MPLNPELFNRLTTVSDQEAWQVLSVEALRVASEPLQVQDAPAEIIRRDAQIGELDHFLSVVSWDLWQSFGASIERTSQRLIRWWHETHGAKAVLILDGLSLRELPWLLQGAQERGYTVQSINVHASELPGETNEFARALGFSSRSQLQSGGGPNHQLQPAETESVDLPFKDCVALVGAQPNWVLWHHWPDSQVHDGSGAGQGLGHIAKDAAQKLNSNDFWALVERLTTGRQLAILSDHGYAATGQFHDAMGELGQFMKRTFASGRRAPEQDAGPYSPPVALNIGSPHGTHLLALGRWKWKSQGGYPTLTHGGLTLLEVLSPFVVLSRTLNTTE